MSFSKKELTLEERVYNLEVRNEAYLNLIDFLLDQASDTEKKRFLRYTNQRIDGAEANNKEKAKTAWEFIKFRLMPSIKSPD